MYLTKPQWEAIRQIAAEQARKVIKEEHDVNPSWVAALEQGFDPSQLTEISQIAGATARKTINQHAWRDQCLQKAYRELDGLRIQLDDAQRIIGMTVSANRRPPGPQDGDKHPGFDGEVFTYFRGAWRRKSEMEGFASAAKYL